MADYITVPLADMRSKPQDDGPLISQLLLGEEVRVLERKKDWSLVENVADRHTGYVAANSLAKGPRPSHVVTALQTPLYQLADGTSPVLARLSFLSRVPVLNVAYGFAKTPHGYLAADTVQPIGEFRSDPLEAARLFAGVPYVWGGRSAAGIDCSALTQLAYAAAGVALPRNAGPQSKVLQDEVTFPTLQPGDLVFIKGHVMIATGPDTVFHADGSQGARQSRDLPLDQALADRGMTRADVTLKKCPTPDMVEARMNALRDSIDGNNPVNRQAFAALSGPDIMS